MGRPLEPSVDSGVRLPRLVGTDLDGTLAGAGQTVSERTAAALRRVSAAGVVVVLVTGRTPRSLAKVYAQLGAWYLSVCANGAVVYDPSEDLVRSCRPIEPAAVREVCRRLRQRLPGVVFAAHVECGRRMVYEPGWPVVGGDEENAFPVGSDFLDGTRVVKLQVRTQGRVEQFGRLVVETVGDLVEATSQGDGGLVEMAQRGVTKAVALAALAQELAISPAEVLVFGDMPNDVSMLRWAGRSVVVANAHPEARRAAREVTSSNVDDGVAVYLERLLVATS